MKRLTRRPVNLVLVTVFFAVALISSLSLGPIGMVSIAEAHHKPGHGCSGGGSSGCGTPPTVSELPIRYMVPGGLALVLVSGGIVYLVRNRNKKPALET